VIVEGDDRYGEGVNIAARLEQIAEPNGIYVSGKVAREVEKKLAFGFELVGERRVKNISEPVQVFRVTHEKGPGTFRPGEVVRRVLPASAGLAAFLLAAAAVWQFWPSAPAAAKPSVAVLPFDNLGGDQASANLATGLTEDIITDLARFPEFTVMARNSTQTYAGKPADPREVGRALNVGFVLDGSIQREADRVRITAQLIDAATGKHLWSNRWDRPDKDFFAVQSEIAEQVTNRLGGLGPDGRSKDRGGGCSESRAAVEHRTPGERARLQ
jgi:TolB-like protein